MVFVCSTRAELWCSQVEGARAMQLELSSCYWGGGHMHMFSLLEVTTRAWGLLCLGW